MIKTSLTRWTRLAGLMGLLAGSAWGAPIPKLFNTGVDDTGALLGASQVDPHYQLVESADSQFPGPNTFTLEPGFPVGPWLAEGPNSRWIAPRARQSVGNAPGNYIYRTTFDLTGFDPTKARINGKWTSDNGGQDIVLNGVSLGLSQGGNFGAFSDFLIESGFAEGTNTLEFVVNNAGEAANPGGLRVEMIGTVELAGEPPRVVTQPVGATVLVGDSLTLTVVADGTPPLTYQWKRNTVDVPGATEPTLPLEAITLAQDGDYTVVISNGSGQTNSAVAKVSVLDRLPGLFDTGVGAEGVLLDDGSTDSHYALVTNPDDPSVTEPFVQDSTVFPIVAGPWRANSEVSKWIGPRFETSAAAGGDYVYELTVDLTGFDPTTAFIAGTWASDNGATVLVNDIATSVVNAGNFDTLSPFRLEGVFLSGVNRLGFRVNNAAAGYTGLRVEGIRGGAKKGSAGEAPRLLTQPVGGVLLTGETLVLSVLADGAAPLSYQWRKDAVNLPGATTNTWSVGPASAALAGSYTVVVTNTAGAVTSAPVAISVLDRVPGVFSTGVDASGVVLADASVDPHYQLVVNPTNPESTEAVVHDSTVFPIVTGPWLANTEVSKWIAPLPDSVGSSGGDYAYRTTFDLTGFDPATAMVLGGWATDNTGTDILLNDVSTGLLNTAGFGGLTQFTISTGLRAGVNTLEFRVNNADAVTGYTGLRVENLRVGARASTTAPPVLAIQLGTGEVSLSWPASANGFKLYSAGSLNATSWTDLGTGTLEGDRRVVKQPTTPAGQFYQLKP